MLSLDSDGDLWLLDGEESRLLGPINDVFDDVPRALWDEYERLLDDYRDSLGAGHMAESRRVWAETRGV